MCYRQMNHQLAFNFMHSKIMQNDSNIQTLKLIKVECEDGSIEIDHEMFESKTSLEMEDVQRLDEKASKISTGYTNKGPFNCALCNRVYV